MDPKTRSMLRITLPQEHEERAAVKDLVDRLMVNNPAHRFAFIQENAARIEESATLSALPACRTEAVWHAAACAHVASLGDM